MSTENTQGEQLLRQLFKYGNHFMVLLFRLGLGSWGNRPETSQVMVLVHKGRKSGLTRRTPVNYAIIDGEIYCTAAFGSRADWYRNIMADPNVEVWLKDGWYAGVAMEVAADDPQRNHVMREVLIASGFAASLFAGIDPKTLSEEKLTAISAPYRLIRIHRTAPRTGPGGPSDLAWVWPAMTFVSMALLLGRRNKVVK